MKGMIVITKAQFNQLDEEAQRALVISSNPPLDFSKMLDGDEDEEPADTIKRVVLDNDPAV
jgi:hypothetical protein